MDADDAVINLAATSQRLRRDTNRVLTVLGSSLFVQAVDSLGITALGGDPHLALAS